jgi:integrase
MRRETIRKITQTNVHRALRLMSADAVLDMEMADASVPGLLIRIRKQSAKWALRCRIRGQQVYRTIGPVLLLQDPDVVRQAAERGKALLREGGDPTSLFESLLQTTTVADASARAAHLEGVVWDWEQAREQFLEACRAHNRPDTRRTYKSALSLGDLSPLTGKVITRIEPDDIRRVRDAIRRRGKIAQSKLTMRALKAMFGWLMEQPESGLKFNPAREVATSVKESPAMPADAIAAASMASDAEAERELSDEELAILEQELESVTPPSARLALRLALRTVQRRMTVVSALKATFRPHPKYGMVWWIHPGVLKVGRTRDNEVRRHPHVLPLPPGAQDFVKAALTLTHPDNPYLFPQLRLRRAGDPGGGHLSERLLNTAVAELQAPGRPLHSAQPFSTHAFRSSFTTHISRAGFTKAQRKLVLDHAEGRTNDVTDKHYDLEQDLPTKFEMLCQWATIIERKKQG